MTAALLPWIALAGAVGAVVRYLATRAGEQIFGSGYPVGTTVVNLVGAFGAGLMAGLGSRPGAAPAVLAVVAVGGLGALTTFSTWMLEAVGMWEAGHTRAATLHVLGQIVAGTVLAFLGFWLGK